MVRIILALKAESTARRAIGRCWPPHPWHAQDEVCWLVPGPDTTAPAGGDDEETRSEVREAPGEIAEALGAAEQGDGEIAEALGAAEQGDGEITNAPGEGARASRVGEEALARGDQAFDQLPAPPGLTAEVGNGDR
jgi:hypothetical protein